MKRKADRVSIRILHIEVLLGLVLAVGVFLTAAHLDMEAAHQMMMTTAQYVKEQCNRYDRIDLADETKSLMRVIQSTRVPIICICNDRESPKVRTLAGKCYDLVFTRPPA